ncbi:mitochondrial matrix Mmp37 family protein [Heterostelium album PN500]|uniref:Phosphatidate cytidylyltransferase, mitochondrial n=1 Tax=Heterostelium pallidum (strain ATCC 26659 / Pp 5 / PN500) TaxID=670386 RepID=D3B0C8_HETP5|nr:mitochondrial matrix Mmp37 family protein [Heterostelium album PN500]EFA84752.1 mitochondrial matrix Mmp37 family protein [Heterostelium album PN500]|eukprot:XP_020436864.1 mitochondrial matrix Mmp37 family protein [Heterostelium album PN500]
MTIEQNSSTADESERDISKKNIKIGIVTCERHPEGSKDDKSMLKQLFDKFEQQCQIVSWTDETVDWEQFTLLIIRSTWDYVGKFEEFKKWLDRIDSLKIKILNDSSVIRWNWNKQYLLELEENGFEIVPSIIVKSDSQTSDSVLSLKEYVKQGVEAGKFDRDQSEYVMKPAVSADAYGTFRFNLDNCQEMDLEFRKYLAEFDMIIQPFVGTIQTDGEDSFLFFNKKFSHACVKRPASQDFRVQENFGGVILPNTNPLDSEIQLASNIVNYISKTKGNLLFARVDMLRYKGRLCLSECELRLFLIANITYNINRNSSSGYHYCTINRNNNNSNGDIKSAAQDDDVNIKIKKILSQFPKIKYGFAYGSGVISQKGYESNSNKQPMIDLVFAVENSEQWHKENIKQNFDHYSFLAYFGESTVTTVQKMAAKVYYNTLLNYNGIRYKYGVIEYNDLLDDLKNWDSLYISGRMMKPILDLPVCEQDALSEMHSVNSSKNQTFAITCALMMLPKQFSEYQLLHQISSISYMGDIRMKGGENPNKIHNIVVNNIESMRAIYMPLIKKNFASYLKIDYSESDNQYHFTQLASTQLDYFEMASLLPPKIRSDVLNNLRKNVKLNNEPTVSADQVRQSISKIVGSSSFNQSAKGVLTAGLFKSVEYIYRKLKSKK